MLTPGNAAFDGILALGAISGTMRARFVTVTADLSTSAPKATPNTHGLIHFTLQTMAHGVCAARGIHGEEDLGDQLKFVNEHDTENTLGNGI